MTDKMKGLIEAVAQAAENIDEMQAARLHGIVQGYTMALNDQESGGDDKQKQVASE